MKEPKKPSPRRTARASRALTGAGPVYLTRRATFAAAHRLDNPAFSRAWNREVFGICNNPNGHGHNYFIEVVVVGEVDTDSAMVMNLRDLKCVIEREIVAECDHKHLNLDVPWLRGVNPTAENLAIAFWRRLERKVAPARLHCVRLLESAENHVEYFGPAGASAR
jgi:6-pyruvoyltetrahydropterin/6-carboxytetrahydropterin synthase